MEMGRTKATRDRRRAIFLASLLVAAAVWVLWTDNPRAGQGSRAARAALGNPAGQPQLVRVTPLPPVEGMQCEWLPASSATTLVGTLRQGNVPARSAAMDGGPRGVEVDRAPARVIRDTYPTYSAIAVDLHSDEVYLQDENLFGYKVFHRLDHTPPGAEFTEPRRMVGGNNTKLEFNCALYVDPQSGDVYSVNNDTMDTMVVFPREARGNVAPMRQLHTPHGTYGIAVDERAGEMFLTVQHINAVMVYRKTAAGEDKPLRTLRGENTELEDPHGVAVDTQRNLLFVSNHGSVKDTQPPGAGRFEPPSITVYPLDASGDTAPLRIIEGSRTGLNWPSHLFADPEHGELYVANDVGDSILVFRATDSGDVSPVREIRGSRTGLKNPTGVFVDTKNDELWVSNMGNHRAVVFPRDASGNVAPLRTIRSAPAEKIALAIGNPGATAYDSKREEILVPN